MIDTLKSIGIEKGKPFNPDKQTRQILGRAIVEAHAWIDAQYEAGFSNPFNEGKHWALPVFPGFLPEAQNGYASPDTYPVDSRGVTYALCLCLLCPQEPG